MQSKSCLPGQTMPNLASLSGQWCVQEPLDFPSVFVGKHLAVHVPDAYHVALESNSGMNGSMSCLGVTSGWSCSAEWYTREDCKRACNAPHVFPQKFMGSIRIQQQ
eukprot:TRINITY_DN2967_c0_g1_i1.p1 TRINITY_DN2967_c0_g1~~TRINITY_DN2967_c0_g1_i1.p1  ORF type:complete len:106 (+),score=0.66 TRINITY_DN2967_c0_g1_i1:627-944(+)